MREMLNAEFSRKILNNKSGFTLIELIVTVTIITILFAVLASNFLGAQQRTRDSKRKAELAQLKTAIEAYRSEHGSYPPDLSIAQTEFYSDTGTNWIPGLSPDYINRLPKDPLQSNAGHSVTGKAMAQTQLWWNFPPVEFSCNGAQQTWTVPGGITSIHVDMAGAGGTGSSPGYGARVQADLSVIPLQTLYINVGCAGGFNGGGVGGCQNPEIDAIFCGGSGGGASDIRIGGSALSNRRIVAGGGGGSGEGGTYNDVDPLFWGGSGGSSGQVGNAGTCGGPYDDGEGGIACYGGTPGGGASQTGGGYSSGCWEGPFASGSLGQGASGNGPRAGGGGGGYYGGGAGSRGCYDYLGSTYASGGGGGGGSSYSSGTNTSYATGYKSGNGYVRIYYDYSFVIPSTTMSLTPLPSSGQSPIPSSGSSPIGTPATSTPNPALGANECNGKKYLYVVSVDRQSYTLWACLENFNDPEIYSKSTASCRLNRPNSFYNYCVKQAD